MDTMQQLATHTFQFAQAVRDFSKTIPLTVANVEDLKSLINCSGKSGENLIRSQEAINQVDFKTRLKSCIEEFRSTHYYLGLIDTQGNADLNLRRDQLMKASEELTVVFRKAL